MSNGTSAQASRKASKISNWETSQISMTKFSLEASFGFDHFIEDSL
jgi:hypothetical protein